ncbi:hypothetical protein E2U79_22430 [Salmonella enterica]|nr:hypothetical protein [Salmonella enterica]
MSTPGINNKNQPNSIIRYRNTEPGSQQDAPDRITSILSDVAGISENNRLTDDRLTTLINHFWSMRGRLNNKLAAEGAADTASEKRYKKRLISLLDELIRESTGVQAITRQSGQMLKTSADRLNISLLRALHRQWHDQTRTSALNQSGNTPEKTIAENPVRDWYKNTGKAQFAHLPASFRLGDALSHLSAATEELWLEGRYRFSPGSLPEKLQDFDAASQSVTGALTELDTQISRMTDIPDKKSRRD